MNDIKTLLWFLMIGGAGLGILLYKIIREDEINKSRGLGILAGIFFLFICFMGTMDIVRYQLKEQVKQCPQCPQCPACLACKDCSPLQTKIDNFCKEHKRASICKEK
jgi:hypothetical protein